MIVEWQSLKCFALGASLSAMAVWKYARYKYTTKHYEIKSMEGFSYDRISKGKTRP